METCAKEVGIAYGFCNSVQIAKDLREIILIGAFGSTREKNCDEHRQGEILCKDNTKRNRTIYACPSEAHESTRKRLQETQNRDHEDHIAEQEYKSIHRAQIYSRASCNEESACKGRS